MNNKIVVLVLVIIVGLGLFFWLQNNREEGGSVVEQSRLATLSTSSWVWVETLMNDDTHITPNQSDAFVLIFNNPEEGRFTLATDCNNMSGTYSAAEDGTLSFGDDIVSTMMYCEGSQETEVSTRLTQIDSYFIRNDGNLVLEVELGGGSMIFRPEAREVEVSSGSERVVHDYRNADESAELTVVFDIANETASVTGFGYANSVFVQTVSASGARYEHEDGFVLWSSGDEITLSDSEGNVLFEGISVNSYVEQSFNGQAEIMEEDIVFEFEEEDTLEPIDQIDEAEVAGVSPEDPLEE